MVSTLKSSFMARMTLDQLEIFLAVARHLHFTRAAEELYISQPSVSSAIQNLEEQYGAAAIQPDRSADRIN